ncbi:GyrI-like domain-containing protein, partial [Enterococcus faecalis]|nr:transcriptional regulator [Enterococcus faecalis]EIQ7150964.1 GyrI-like domain-containing protein [Enterococcus faecalis]EIZ1152955.1 GyrI-like domain-containing protein [Enterococcus faecalis]
LRENDVIKTNYELENFFMNYTIETIPTQQFAYMRRIGPYGEENYVLMATFKEWIQNNGLFNEDTVIYAVARDNPEMVAPGKCRYDVGISVVSTFPNSKDINIGSLFSGGKYMIFQIEHTIEGVNQFWMTFEDIFKQQNITNNVEKPILERYDKKLLDKGYCEMCVPLD